MRDAQMRRRHIQDGIGEERGDSVGLWFQREKGGGRGGLSGGRLLRDPVLDVADVEIHVPGVEAAAEPTHDLLRVCGELGRYVDGVDDGSALGAPGVPGLLYGVSGVWSRGVVLRRRGILFCAAGDGVFCFVRPDGPVLEVLDLRAGRERRRSRVCGLDCARQVEGEGAVAGAGFKDFQRRGVVRVAVCCWRGDVDVQEGDDEVGVGGVDLSGRLGISWFVRGGGGGLVWTVFIPG